MHAKLILLVQERDCKACGETKAKFFERGTKCHEEKKTKQNETKNASHDALFHHFLLSKINKLDLRRNFLVTLAEI